MCSRHVEKLTVLDEFTWQALAVEAGGRMTSNDVSEVLYRPVPVPWETGARPQRQRPGIRLRSHTRVARTGRREATEDLSGLPMGEWTQRTLQRDAPPRSSQRRMVHHDQAGSDRHRYMAQAIQSHPPASGVEHAATGARDSSQKWPSDRRLDMMTPALSLGRLVMPSSCRKKMPLRSHGKLTMLWVLNCTRPMTT